MIFCGQCGLQLAPGTTRCQRCGATVEETNAQATELHSNDATIASSLTAHNPAGLSQVSPPQPLILRPGTSSNDYGSQIPYDATSRMEAPNYGTQMPQNPNIGSTYAGNYPQQSGNNYPDFTNHAPGTYGGGGYPMNTQRGYQQPYTQETNKGRTTALVLVLLGVLFLVIAVILFVLQRTNAIAGTAPTISPTAIISTTSTTTRSDTQLGQQTIQQYYDDLNQQHYRDAYNLWKNPPESFVQFRSGFQRTRHDNVRFDNVIWQSDGAVKVTVTVTATEEIRPDRTEQSFYAGYYMAAKQDNNSWKITNSLLQKQ